MTKLGFVAKGMAENRSKAKRRKAPVSSGSAVARSPVFSFAGADGIVIRITSVHPPRRRKFATLKRTMVAQQKSNAPKIKHISAEASSELSFRMLSALDDRMKEEEFDAFE